MTDSSWAVVWLWLVARALIDRGPDVGDEVAACLTAGPVLAHDPAGSESAVQLAHLPSERGGFHVEGLDEFSGGTNSRPPSSRSAPRHSTTDASGSGDADIVGWVQVEK